MEKTELEQIDSEIKAEWLEARRIREKLLGIIYVICGGAATLFSFLLTLDKIEQVKDADAKFGCDVNLFISCGSVMKTAQAEIFGFPNSIIGLVVFAAIFGFGVSLINGFKPAQLIRWGLVLTMLGSLAMVVYLFLVSVFELRTLCPYCSGVWLSTLLMVTSTFAYAIQDLNLPFKVKNFFSHWLLNFGLIALLALVLVIVQFFPLLMRSF